MVGQRPAPWRSNRGKPPEAKPPEPLVDPLVHHVITAAQKISAAGAEPPQPVPRAKIARACLWDHKSNIVDSK